MRIKFNPHTEKLRLHGEGRRECYENVAEIKLGEKIFYVQLYNDDLRQRLLLLHSEDFSPNINQEIAFLLKRLREAVPVVVIIGRRVEVLEQTKLRQLWLQSLREYDLNRARKIKEFLERGGDKKYLFCLSNGRQGGNNGNKN